MRRTDPERAAALAGALFDDVLVPIAQARRAAGAAPWFALGPEPGAQSYWTAPACPEMALAELAFPGGGTAEGLVDAIAAHWTAEGETALAALAPRLKAIAAALDLEAAAQDGEVDILCYTLF